AGFRGRSSRASSRRCRPGEPRRPCCRASWLEGPSEGEQSTEERVEGHQAQTDESDAGQPAPAPAARPEEFNRQTEESVERGTSKLRVRRLDDPEIIERILDGEVQESRDGQRRREQQ